MRRFGSLTALAALALSMSGCKKPAPEAADSDVSNALTQVPADDNDAPVPPIDMAPLTPPPVANAVQTPPPVAAAEPIVREEQQITEDAEASGMTARLPAERDTLPAGEQANATADQ